MQYNKWRGLRQLDRESARPGGLQRPTGMSPVIRHSLYCRPLGIILKKIRNENSENSKKQL